jgi:hypothetical protein
MRNRAPPLFWNAFRCERKQAERKYSTASAMKCAANGSASHPAGQERESRLLPVGRL